MNERIITFAAHPNIVKDKSIHPEPAIFHIPQWYKDVPNPDIHTERTIKACKPFLDSLTAGYILKNPIDQKINFNVKGPNDKLNVWIEYGTILGLYRNEKQYLNVNMGTPGEVHGIDQVGGEKCPFVKENKNFPIFKILNPWTILVPKGYSVFYMQPINRAERRFEIFSGIVDGPCSLPTNFPCVIKKEGTWVLEKGAPIASVFPFKKESWKMKIEEWDEKKLSSFLYQMSTFLMKWYEKVIWNKQKWR
jgi:hypothetical protein